MNATTLYMLITVTSSGIVHHADGFQTLHDCQEAKSLALTSQTIEQYQAQQEQYKAARKKADDDFAATHPAREPKNDAERDVANGVRSMMFISCGLAECRVVPAGNGLVREEVVANAGFVSFALDGPNVKVAECVIRAEPDGSDN